MDGLEVVVILGAGPLGLSFCRNPFEHWRPRVREWAVLESVTGQAEQIGLEPGLLLSAVAGCDCSNMPFEDIIPLLVDEMTVHMDAVEAGALATR